MKSGHDKMEDLNILLQLLLMPGVGYATIERILQTPGALQACGQGEIGDSLGIRPSIASLIKSKMKDERHRNWVERERKNWKREQIGIIPYWDETYPAVLRHIHQPPHLFFYKGNLQLLNQPKIGIVGTRKPTAYGKRAAQQFAEQLSRHGITVVSGMARGIDGLSHQAAIPYPGKSIGVIAGGFRHIYPPEFNQLYGRMGEEGLLLSEYPPHIKPHPSYFPMRNRLISGLSAGVIVVEAAKRSGSLITADLALEQGKEVFCLPGSIFSLQSEGTNNLIKQGAVCLTDWQEIFYHLPQFAQINKDLTEASPPNLPPPSAEMKEILHLFQAHGRLDPEQIAAETGRPVSQLLVLLLQMELEGRIMRLSGGAYEMISMHGQ